MELVLPWLGYMLIGAGVAKVVAKDLFWRWTAFQYGIVGLVPTRTRAWERWTTLSGGLWIALGIAIVVIAP